MLGLVTFLFCRCEALCDMAWRQIINLDAPVQGWVSVYVFAYEKLLAHQLSVHRAVHLHFTTYLANVPDNDT